MKQIVVIGLGSFGQRVVEELQDMDVEIVIIDKDCLILGSHGWTTGSKYGSYEVSLWVEEEQLIKSSYNKFKSYFYCWSF